MNYSQPGSIIEITGARKYLTIPTILTQATKCFKLAPDVEKVLASSKQIEGRQMAYQVSMMTLQ